MALAGTVGDQVPEVAYIRLADPVDAAEALLQPVGVPRQVVVHHQVGALQIDPFARRVRGQQYPHFGIVVKRLLGLEPVTPVQSAVDDDHGLGSPDERRDPIVQVVEGVLVLGEDDQLLTEWIRSDWRSGEGWRLTGFPIRTKIGGGQCFRDVGGWCCHITIHSIWSSV